MREGMPILLAAHRAETARPVALVSTSLIQLQMDASIARPARMALAQRLLRIQSALPVPRENTQLALATLQKHCACHAVLER
jgi:hypothetical protein